MLDLLAEYLRAFFSLPKGLMLAAFLFGIASLIGAIFLSENLVTIIVAKIMQALRKRLGE